MGRFTNLEFSNEENRRPEEERRVDIPRDEKYYLSLATDQFRDGKYEGALKHYSRALEFNTRLSEGWLGQVQALLELDEANEARVWADKGLELFRNHPEMLAAKGVACARMGDLDKGLALSDAALAEKGDSPYRWRARGDVLLSRGDRNEEFCFAKSLAAAGTDWWEPLAVGRIYMRFGRWATAVRHAEEACTRNPKSAFAWETLARCAHKTGLDEKSRTAWRNAGDLDADRRSMAESMQEDRSWWDTVKRTLFGKRG